MSSPTTGFFQGACKSCHGLSLQVGVADEKETATVPPNCGERQRHGGCAALKGIPKNPCWFGQVAQGLEVRRFSSESFVLTGSCQGGTRWFVRDGGGGGDAEVAFGRASWQHGGGGHLHAFLGFCPRALTRGVSCVHRAQAAGLETARAAGPPRLARRLGHLPRDLTGRASLVRKVDEKLHTAFSASGRFSPSLGYGSIPQCSGTNGLCRHRLTNLPRCPFACPLEH